MDDSRPSDTEQAADIGTDSSIDPPDDVRRREVASSAFLRYRSRAAGGSGIRDPRRWTRKRPNSRDSRDDDHDAGAEKDSPEDGSSGWSAPPGTYRSKTGTGHSRWDPQPLGSILGKESHGRGWDHQLSLASVTADWSDIVGEQVAQHCPIESFENGTLVARADSTAWAQQLQLLLPMIHRRIDERVGAGVVERVIVRPPEARSWSYGRRHVKGRGPRDTYG